MEETVIDDLKAIIENQKLEIAHLEDTIKNFESIQRWKCSVCKKSSVQIKDEIKCFEDDYFKGLSFETIAQLAKKSIRLTDDNNRLIHKLEDIEEVTDDKRVLDIIERTD